MITGSQLKEWGLPSGPVFGIAIMAFQESKADAFVARSVIQSIIKDPEHFAESQSPYANIAKMLVKTTPKRHTMLNSGCPTTLFGEHMIEIGALSQIAIASKLPISLRAAVMPDGHQGYSIPIGGVLATDNVVIPFAVGVDIACRMKITITNIPGSRLEGMRGKLRHALLQNTVFGAGQTQDENAVLGDKQMAVLDDIRFKEIPAIKKMNLQHTAIKSIGTSGGGNHFVEFGIYEGDTIKGPLIAILSHSGSRGIGYKIATHYSRLAQAKCDLPKEARHLAWLSMDSAEGQEYWSAMQLCGDFASACHDMIHNRLMESIGAVAFGGMENHHNFAWKEKLADGREAIIHRKGATPAGKGVAGIIPGSMASNTYLVRGKGNAESMCSSSHGAGRMMSRTAAKEQYTMSDMKKDLLEKGVELLGGSVDECRMAYKDIDKVMEAQQDLVEIVGTFQPKIVRMSEDGVEE